MSFLIVDNVPIGFEVTLMAEKGIDCPVRDNINTFCSCPKTDCMNHGLCCECIVAHKNRVDEPIIKRFPNCLRDLVEEAMSGGMGKSHA